MSRSLPEHKFEEGDIPGPIDSNKTTLEVRRAVTDLNEHNVRAALGGGLTRSGDLEPDVCGRVYVYRNVLADDLLNGNHATANLYEMQQDDTWEVIHTLTYTSTQRAELAMTADITTRMTSEAGTDDNSGSSDDQWFSIDNVEMRYAWLLDGTRPTQYSSGSEETADTSVNFEIGVGGAIHSHKRFAFFDAVPPGTHTITLVALKRSPEDGYSDTDRGAFIMGLDLQITENYR